MPERVAAMTTNPPDGAAPDTVVLIHGLWMTALSWENWAARYRQRGFNVIARSWPGMGGDIDAPELQNKRLILGCFPWKFKGGEAAFARVVGFVGEWG